MPAHFNVSTRSSEAGGVAAKDAILFFRRKKLFKEAAKSNGLIELKRLFGAENVDSVYDPAPQYGRRPEDYYSLRVPAEWCYQIELQPNHPLLGARSEDLSYSDNLHKVCAIEGYLAELLTMHLCLKPEPSPANPFSDPADTHYILMPQEIVEEPESVEALSLATGRDIIKSSKSLRR